MNENEGSAVDAVHPERPGGWVRRADGWALLMDSDGEVAGELAPEDVAALRVLLLVPPPPVAPPAVVDVTALPEWDALVEEIDGRDSIPEGAYSVLHRSTLAVADHAVELVAAARRAAGEADRG